MSARPARPPTTPPAMAPVLLEPLAALEVGGAVDDCVGLAVDGAALDGAALDGVVEREEVELEPELELDVEMLVVVERARGWKMVYSDVAGLLWAQRMPLKDWTGAPEEA